MNAFILAWRMLGRDLRSGELAILLTALLIAVGSVSSVGFFADRVRLGLERESRQMLGADLLLISDHAWDPQWNARAAASGLATAGAVTFPSMVQANGDAQLAEIKAVTPGYPLRGTMRTAPALNVPDAATRGTPPRGAAWLDERMMSVLGVKVGDRIAVGRLEVRVDAVLTLEPDRGISFFALAPRVLMHRDDLDATGLIQSGSRVT
jgi:putative ABC transport system permease protein